MTLQELSVEYRAHARALDFRICQLQATGPDGGRGGTLSAGRADPNAVYHVS